MSNIVKTTKDGWGVSPAIEQTARTYDTFGHLFYEIKHCVRTMTPDEMIAELRYFAQCLIEEIDNAESEVGGLEYETIEECDDDEG